MSATLIDGKAHAAQLRQNIAAEVKQLKASHGLTPGLTVVLVGEDPASQVYVRNKIKQTEEVGMHSHEIRLPVTATQGELLKHIDKLNTDPAVHGILVQLPLPKQIDAQAVIARISPEKDVDGFHPVNAGKLAIGQTGFVPCTPLGCLYLLRETLGNIAGKHAVVVGRSNIVGKPMAQLLLQADCTVTIAHSRTKDLSALTREADILVAAVGRPEMIRGKDIKQGACVIDVGMNRIQRDGKDVLTGDVAFAEAKEIAGSITPVPGGVGPMTIACLLVNTLHAAAAQAHVSLNNPAALPHAA